MYSIYSTINEWKRFPIRRPPGWDMSCFTWVFSRQYDRVIRKAHCIHFEQCVFYWPTNHNPDSLCCWVVKWKGNRYSIALPNNIWWLWNFYLALYYSWSTKLIINHQFTHYHSNRYCIHYTEGWKYEHLLQLIMIITINNNNNNDDDDDGGDDLIIR